jgi:hypothetical protein
MKYLFLFLAVLVSVIITGCELKGNMTGEAVTEGIVKEIPAEEGPEIEVYFCPRENCEEMLHKFISSAEKSVHCALFELNLESIKKIMDEKSRSIDVKLVVDNDYYDEVSELSFAKQDDGNQLSHNKFCVVDGMKVFTGSFNPTERDAYFNNNNMLLIESEILARNYEDEFSELWNGTFGEGAEVKNPALVYNGKLIHNYFCPEDSCADRVIDELKKANQSIYFMTFSFTHKGIGTAAVLRLNEGVDVKGVYEYKNMKDSTYDLLNYQGADVKADGNPYNLHHKVFIIDEKTVITGSFNPTGAGDYRNDENLIIIEDMELAKKYIKEFVYVWNFNSSKLDSKKKAKDVILYEVMYDADGSDEGNEYVVLKNVGNSTVDLGYWRLSDGKNNFVLSGSVSAGEEIKFMPSFSLRNSEGLIILRDRSMNNVDYAAYEGMWNITAKEGQKLVRNDTLWVNCEECWTVED